MENTPAYQELEAKHNKLLNAVAAMRKFQKDWNLYHASIDKEKMRIWEREVDKQIASAHKEQISKQAKIF